MMLTLALTESLGVRSQRRHRTHHSLPGRPPGRARSPLSLLRGPRSAAHATADNLVDRNRNPSRGGHITWMSARSE